MTGHTCAECGTVWKLRLIMARLHLDHPAYYQIRDEIGDCARCWWKVVDALVKSHVNYMSNDEVGRQERLHGPGRDLSVEGTLARWRLEEEAARRQVAARTEDILAYALGFPEGRP